MSSVSTSTQSWLLLGLGAVVLGGVGYMVYTTYQSQSWPPSAEVQQSILNQILSANQAVGGQPPTPAQSAQLAASIAQAPASYAAGLPAGQAPTVAGYTAWMSANVNSYVAQGGVAGGFAPTLGA